jgi:hypothetical protein
MWISWALGLVKASTAKSRRSLFDSRTVRTFVKHTWQRQQNWPTWAGVGENGVFGLTDLAKDQIMDAVGYHLIPLYWLVEPAAVIIILVMFIVGMVRMLLEIMVRAMVIAHLHGCGFWMFGALWDTAF